MSGLAPGSRPTMRQTLNVIASMLTDGRCDARTLDWAALRYRHTAAVRSALMEKYAPKTANNMLTALRRTLKEALRLELMDASDYARAVDIKGIKAVRGLRGRALNSGEIADLMGACLSDPTPLGARDAALIAILRGTGLRRAEVVGLDLRDFTTSTGALEVRAGKGNKDRTVYLPDGLLPIVEDWLNVRGRERGPLLCHVNKAGRVVLSHVNKAGMQVVRRLTPQAVLFLLQKRAGEAGVASFSPHDFRRTFVSDLLDAGADIVTISKLAGHADISTTALYSRRGEEVKKRAVNLLKI